MPAVVTNDEILWGFGVAWLGGTTDARVQGMLQQSALLWFVTSVFNGVQSVSGVLHV